MQVATTHNLLDGSREPWNPTERITLQEALQIYTSGSSFVNFLENQTGTLEQGKDADFIIVDRNLFEINVNDVHKTEVLATYVAGKKLYEKDS
jgi:predicted amidohydrolase YtcJ